MNKSLLVLAALAAVCCSASAWMYGEINSAKGLRVSGYTFYSEVVGYVNMTQDSCDIKAAVEAGDMATALNIYANGKNGRRGAGFRTLNSWARLNATGEPNYDAMVMYFGGYNFSESAIRTAFAEGKGHLALNLIADFLYFSYKIHEVNDAYSLTEQGETTNLDTGSVHTIDEGIALWAALNDCGMTLYERADATAEEMGTTMIGTSPINLAMPWVYNDLVYHSMRNDTASYDEVRTYLNVLLMKYSVQNALAKTYGAEIARACRNTPKVIEAKAAVEANFHWIAPHAEAWGVDTTELKKAVFRSRPTWAGVSSAMKKVVEGLGMNADIFTWEELGTPKADVIKAHMGLESCTRNGPRI